MTVEQIKELIRARSASWARMAGHSGKDSIAISCRVREDECLSILADIEGIEVEIQSIIEKVGHSPNNQ